MSNGTYCMYNLIHVLIQIMTYLPLTERILGTAIFPTELFCYCYHIILYPHVCFEYMLKIIIIIRPRAKREARSLMWRGSHKLHHKLGSFSNQHLKADLEILINYITFWLFLGNSSWGTSARVQKLLIQL